MPNNAEHLHYYIFSKGKYKRKLISKLDFNLLILSGAKDAYASDNPVYSHISKSVTADSAKSRLLFYAKIQGKVYFPYVCVSEKSLKGINAKFRAVRHNMCVQCGPLEAYWNQGGSNEQGN